MKNLIVCHGWGANPLIYRNFIKKAPKDWQVTVLNYQTFARDRDLEKFNQNLNQFLAENNLEKIYLMGHSMGGLIALNFAHQHSEKIERLFLVDSEGIPEKELFIFPVSKIFANSLKHYLTEFSLSMMTTYKILRNPHWHLKMGFFAHQTNFEKEAQELKVPVTIIWGEADPVIPLRRGQKIHQLIKNSKLITIPKMGHNWIVYYPEKFWANVVE